ncbi:hypothetical protein BDV98DRAFT_595977 [Pterulicium gracile]|uniref:DUF6535 domain-containing protein n=1 Tax=Pterulicium gracile TaxID=1884261 RepID=A0A5C3Q8W4_9AGAR|nr:hypothetical protein BDV98DRAFT_595977 [Pterula gracilis]
MAPRPGSSDKIDFEPATAGRDPLAAHSKACDGFYNSKRSASNPNDERKVAGNERRRRSTIDEHSETREVTYELLEATPRSTVQEFDTSTNSEVKSHGGHKRPFIMRRRTTQKTTHEQAQFTSGVPQVADGEVNDLNYEKRFRPDKRGKEKQPKARIRRVYLNEAGQFDLNMIESMRDTVDVILVFSSLFSAIVTTLVALTATALQLDHPQVTNRLLMEVIALQRIALTHQRFRRPGRSLPTQRGLPSQLHSQHRRLLGQRTMIQAYEAPSFQGTARARAEVRGFRYYGIDKWHVPLIIGLLPTLLHLALFLFFAGLIVFLSRSVTSSPMSSPESSPSPLLHT